MTSPFYDNFTKTRLLTSNIINPNSISEAGTGFAPSSWIRTIGFTGSAWGMTDSSAYTFVINQSNTQNVFGSVGGDTSNTVRRPPNTYAINETVLARLESASSAPFYFKTYYLLKYVKNSGGPTLNISGFSGIRFNGMGQYKTSDTAVTYEEISVKPTFYSNGLLLNKLTGGSIVLNPAAGAQTFPLSLLNPEPLFNPSNVVRVDLEFMVGRNITPNTLPLLYYAFFADQITLV